MLLGSAALSSAFAAGTCAHPDKALGVSRVIEIDTQSGPLFGEFTKLEKEPHVLGPKEVALTFDDGPMPKYTKPILDALDEYCTKATFFNVGEMALEYPSMVKEVIGRGHVVGTHTWSHPMNLRHLTLDKAKDQIERGFAAVTIAAGQPIAPFFRFPGLSDSGPLMAYLQERGIAAFTVDVVSNDSYIGSASALASRTISQVQRQNGGIVLFHDIKASTAKALPTILAALKKDGYKIVLLRAKGTYTPPPAITAELEAKIAAKTAKDKGGSDKASNDKAGGDKTANNKTGSDKDAKGDSKTAAAEAKPTLIPFYAAVPMSTLEASNSEPAVTLVAPEKRERTHEGGTHATASTPVATAEEAPSSDATVEHSAKRKRHAQRARAKKSSSFASDFVLTGSR
jgi:peptidoglycan/xylan/chitin deacetylase (PgdA/CDA1 family)